MRDVQSSMFVLSLMTDVDVSIEQPDGVMTRAPGTLQWMAPEVFRGDTRYTTAIDVFSYGIVMWEVATREVPWRELSYVLPVHP